ncbi:MAG: hypothetical protein AAFR75_05445 [Pseudomonadota bacterium]
MSKQANASGLRPPYLLDVAVRIIAWGFVAAMLLGPISILFLASKLPSSWSEVPAAGTAAWDATDGASKALLRNIIHTKKPITGPEPMAAFEQLKKLQKAAAMPGEAQGILETVEILVISYTEVPEERQSARPGFREIALHLERSEGRGLVLVSEQPLFLKLSGGPFPRAHLAYEGNSLFDFEPFQEGFLSGFRSGTLGAGKVLSRDDFKAENNHVTRKGCRTLGIWSRHFNLPLDRFYVTLVQNTHHVAVLGSRLIHDGSRTAHISNVGALCR